MSRQGTIVEPTVDGQIMFNGFAMGADTPYSWVQLDGWDDMPGIDSGNRPRPGQHGSWAGTKYYQERIITLAGRIKGDPASYAALVSALRRATALPEDDAEFPFVVRKDGISEVSWAVCTSRVIPNNKEYRVGLGQYALQFVASDPNIYSAQPAAPVSMGVGTGSGGLVFPLVFPLDFGTPAKPATATAVNTGETSTPTVIVINGPATNPTLWNATAGKRLGFDLVMVVGETLTIDTAAGTALLDGADRRYLRSADSGPITDFTLKPGNNDLTFFVSGGDSNTLATVTWYNAR